MLFIMFTIVNTLTSNPFVDTHEVDTYVNPFVDTHGAFEDT